MNITMRRARGVWRERQRTAGDQRQCGLCLAVPTSTVPRIAFIRRHVLVEYSVVAYIPSGLPFETQEGLSIVHH
jgi:hypothetical protein